MRTKEITHMTNIWTLTSVTRWLSCNFAKKIEKVAKNITKFLRLKFQHKKVANFVATKNKWFFFKIEHLFDLIIDAWVIFLHLNSRLKFWNVFSKFWKSKFAVEDGFQQIGLYHRSPGIPDEIKLTENPFYFSIGDRETKYFQNSWKKLYANKSIWSLITEELQVFWSRV